MIRDTQGVIAALPAPPAGEAAPARRVLSSWRHGALLIALLICSVVELNYNQRIEASSDAGPFPAGSAAAALPHQAKDGTGESRFIVQLEPPCTPEANVDLWMTGARVLRRDRRRAEVTVAARAAALARLKRLSRVRSVRAAVP